MNLQIFAPDLASAEFRDIPQQTEPCQARLRVLFHKRLLLLPLLERIGLDCEFPELDPSAN
jgi:hypothetical protein